MRIQRNQEYDLLYIELHNGEVEETVDLAEGVYADVDIEGRVLGIEFLSIEAFDNFTESAGGDWKLPDWIVPDHMTTGDQPPSRFQKGFMSYLYKLAQERIEQGDPEGLPGLTDNQLEVMKLIGEGRTYRQIADQIGLSVYEVNLAIREIHRAVMRADDHLPVDEQLEAGPKRTSP